MKPITSTYNQVIVPLHGQHKGKRLMGKWKASDLHRDRKVLVDLDNREEIPCEELNKIPCEIEK